MAPSFIECKAAVAWAPGQPLSIETITVEQPHQDEVRIKIEYTSVCRSDILGWKGDMATGFFPYVLGHEGAGIVESVGKGVTKLKAGDKVVPLYLPECGQCKYCNNSRSNLCTKLDITGQNSSDGSSRMSCKGKTLCQFLGISTFSEYTVVPQTAVAKLDDDAPLDRAVLLGCGISTGLGAALNTANVQKDEDIIVLGLGAVGLAVALGAKMRGAKRIIGVDIDDSKFELAKVFGVNEFINPNNCKDKQLHEVVQELTNGGVHHAFECIGNIKMMETAFNCTDQGWGQTIVIGITGPQETMSVNPLFLSIGRSIKGSLFGGWQGKRDIPKLMDQYMKGELLIDEFITHRRDSLDVINEVFSLLKDGKCLRCVVAVK